MNAIRNLRSLAQILTLFEISNGMNLPSVINFGLQNRRQEAIIKAIYNQETADRLPRFERYDELSGFPLSRE